MQVSRVDRLEEVIPGPRITSYTVKRRENERAISAQLTKELIFIERRRVEDGERGKMKKALHFGS
jgi:hypothetical protein